MIIHCSTPIQIKYIAHLYKLTLLDSVFVLNSIWNGVCIDTIKNEYHSIKCYDDSDIISYDEREGSNYEQTT